MLIIINFFNYNYTYETDRYPVAFLVINIFF